LINSGVRYISFFGHSSSSGFEYNLNSPNRYNANPNFPVFMAFGCDVARIYNLTNTKTITEDYVNSKNGGSIVMLASNNLGYPSKLNPYLQNIYRSLAFRDYDKTLGMQY